MRTPSLFCAASLLAAPLLQGCPSTPTAAKTPISTPAGAPKKPELVVSSANFRSLKWHNSGGYYSGRQAQMWIAPRSVRLRRGHPENKPETQVKSLNDAELQGLVRVLNDAQLPRLAAKPSRMMASDEIVDELTLVLQTPNEKARSFAVIYHFGDSGYGKTGDKALLNVMEKLRALRNQKFPQAAPITRPKVKRTPRRAR